MSTINKLVYGDLTFTDEQIQDGEVYEAMALLSDALEIGTLRAELYIRDEGVGAALTAFRRNDRLLYYYRDELRGTYYIESVQRTGKYTYELSANDAVALLEQSSHMGGIYTGQTVEELVRDICNIPYFVQSKLKPVKLYGWLPVATRRANLAQVLFAVGAHLKVDLNGVLRIETLWDGVASAIDPDRVFWGDRVRYAAKITEVSVLEHQYIPGTEEVTLFEGAAASGDLIQFSEPVHSLTASGFAILEQGANFARVSGGSGTLTGQKYVHLTRDVRVEATPDEVANVVEVKEATLVSLVNSAAVAERLASYYRLLETMDGEVVYGGERPGDVVAFEHPYGGESFGCIKSASLTMGGTLVSEETTAIGYRPIYGSGDLVDNRELISSNTTWTEPEGIVSLRVVLIGGGYGGYGGGNGLPGESGLTSPGQGGKGGAGGAGGNGGKILQIDVGVSPGKIHSITVGPGGVGGAAEAPGEDGTPTTFDGYTSTAGTSSQDGFLDPVTQAVYAKPGISGICGADGGRGGNGTNSPEAPAGVGQSGKDVDGFTGGAGGTYRMESSEWYGEGISYGGGGGGAAIGENGGDGDRGHLYAIDDIQGTGPGMQAIGGTGGTGGDAAKIPITPSLFGTGGTGGDGGGGGGGGGGGQAKSVWPSAGGEGGAGSQGGAGGSGCAILYYSVKRKISSSPLQGKNGCLILDKIGRRVIV